MSHNGGRFIGVREVAQLLGMSQGWVRLQVYKGTLPYYRFGKVLRFDPDEVLETVRKKRAIAPRTRG